MMSRPGSSVIEVLRGWLQDEMGDGANIYHQCPVEPARDASDAHRFSISVPAGDVESLMLLRNRAVTVRRNGQVLVVVRIVPEGAINSHGRIAKRDFVLHIRSDG